MPAAGANPLGRSPSISHALSPLSPFRWTAKGILYLTTTRLVFIAGGGPPDPSGLVAFALPFTALAPSTEFKQPIFAANHLSGVCAGATGEAHAFKLEFKEGGVGTFLPLYFRLLEYARAVAASGGGGGAGGSGAAAAAADAKPAPPPAVAQAVATAFVDPSDPSKLFLTQPDGGK